jgi:protein MpaA
VTNLRNLLIVASIVTMVGCLVMLPDPEPEPQQDLQSSASLPAAADDIRVTAQAPAESIVEDIPESRVPPAQTAHAGTLSVTEPVAAMPADGVAADVTAAPQIPAPVVHQAAVDDLCREIGNKLGSVSVSDCTRQGLQFADGFSVKNRVLTKRDFLPKDFTQPVSRIMIMGGIHGDEYSSISIMFKWMDLLANQQNAEFHWRFMPLANPDGLLDGTATRQNANGVDLNRNFPSGDWERTALETWRQATGSNPRRFPGHSPASEPETRWILEQIEEFKPVVIVSVHAPHALLDFDGPVEAPHKIGHLHLHQLGVYPGSLGNYGGLDLGIPVITLELPSAGIMPSRAEIENMWVDLNKWLSDKAPGLTESKQQGSGISAD